MYISFPCFRSFCSMIEIDPGGALEVELPACRCKQFALLILHPQRCQNCTFFFFCLFDWVGGPAFALLLMRSSCEARQVWVHLHCTYSCPRHTPITLMARCYGACSCGHLYDDMLVLSLLSLVPLGTNQACDIYADL